MKAHVNALVWRCAVIPLSIKERRTAFKSLFTQLNNNNDEQQLYKCYFTEPPTTHEKRTVASISQVGRLRHREVICPRSQNLLTSGSGHTQT